MSSYPRIARFRSVDELRGHLATLDAPIPLDDAPRSAADGSPLARPLVLGDRTVGNLAALHAAGARVLYGTDFGNRRTAGIDASELALMGLAGMSPGEILASGTREPADYWDFADLGAIEVGRSASLLVLDRDPLLDPLSLAEPTEVWSRGRRRR